MAWTVPTLKDLIERITNDIASRTEDKTVLVRHSLPWILARVLAGAVADLYQWAAYMSRQVIPLTAEGEWLDAWARIWGITRQPAQTAWGSVSVQGQVGATVAQGAILTDGLGHEWEVLQQVTLSGASALVPVQARAAGSNGNVSGGAVLTFVSPPTDIESEVVVLQTSGITGGSGTAKAKGYVRVTATSGSTLPAGTVIQRYDGKTYTVDADVTWTADGDQAVAVTASATGSEYDTDPLTPMDIQSPPVGVTARCYVVADGIYGGTDAETDADLRTRLLQHIRQPPHGGALPDYETWALDLEDVDVEKAWAFAYPDLALGKVKVYFTVQDTDPIPTSAQVSAMQSYLEDLAPAGIQVTAAAPSKQTVDITIKDLTVQAGYSLTDVQSAIEDALATLFRSYEVQAIAGTVYNSEIHAAIAGVEGVDHYTLIDVGGGGATADVSVAAYTLPVLGTVTWQ